ncbi:MAG: hypothetical protein IID45_11205 [Planctomycetes bacterium]|nr:hypothetical protein [Planctomycetota bacterium]
MQLLSLRHKFEWSDDFIGGGSFGVSASEADPWVITDTSAAGAPTYQRLDLGESTIAGALGTARLAFSSDVEVQNLCLSFGDLLAFDIDKLHGFECRIKQNQATKDATTTLAFGVAGDRNDAIDTIAKAALFRLAGLTAVNTVVCESDDGTNNNDDIDTSDVLANAFKVFRIDFTDLSNVKFYMEDSGGSLVRVVTGTTFDMSNYDAGVQPFFQLQKTSDSNTDGIDIDYVQLWGVR